MPTTLKIFRVAAGFSQHELIKRLRAEKLEISQTILSLWERGYKHPSPEARKALARALSIKEELLMDNSK